jgi:hypothetical protein
MAYMRRILLALFVGGFIAALGVGLWAYEAPLKPVKPFQPIDLTGLRFPDKHPLVFYSPDEIARVRQIIATGDASLAHVKFFQTIERNAKMWVNLDVKIDPLGSEYGNLPGGMCPKDSADLLHKRVGDGVWFPTGGTPRAPTDEVERTLPAGAWVHVCPRCGTFYQGAQYDSYARGAENLNFARRVQDLGLAYAFTGDERYAQRVRQIMMGFAEIYSGVKTLVNYEGLRLNYWIEYVTIGYDLAYESRAFSAADHAFIANNLLRPLADGCMRGAGKGRNNRSAYTISQAAAIGFLLRDRDIVEFCLNNPDSGFAHLMENSVDEDGLWSERMNYQWYTMQGLTGMVEPAYRAGINLYLHPRFHNMLAGMVLLQLPDGSVDDRAGRLPVRRYEVGQLRAPDPLFESVLRRTDMRNLEVDVRSMWVVPTWQTSDGPGLTLPSKNFTGWGYAILRSGQAPEQSFLSMTWLDHAIYGGHMEALKFAVIYHAGGRLWTPFTIPEYTVGWHGAWARKPVAHNALTVDGESQAVSFGWTTAFQAGPRLQVAAAAENHANPGVSQQRMIMLADGYAIDVCRAKSATEHRYDLAERYFGTMTTAETLQPWRGPLGWQSGYEYVEQVRSARKSGTWSADWRQDDGHAMRLTMLGAAGGQDTELIAGKAPGRSEARDVDMMLARRFGKQTAFISLMEAYGDRPTIQSVEMLSGRQEQATVAKITRTGGVDYLLATVDGGVIRSQDLELEGEFGLISTATGSDGAGYAQLVNGRRLAGGGWSVTADQPATLYIERAANGNYLVSADNLTSGAISLQGRSANGAKVSVSGTGAAVNATTADNSLRFDLEAGKTYEVSGVSGLAQVALQVTSKPVVEPAAAAPRSPARVVGATIEGKNRVRNSGFEINGPEYAKVDPWQYQATCTYDNTVAHSGTYSLKLPRRVWFSPVTADAWALQKEVLASPGTTTWTVSAYVRADNPTKVRIALFANEAGWGGNDTNGMSETIPVDKEWKRISVTRTFPAGITSAGIVIRRDLQGFGGQVWVDDVQLESGPAATDYTADAWTMPLP